MNPCECGCGQEVSLAKRSDKRRNLIKGEPLRFVKGHWNRRERQHQWNGGLTCDGQGYVYILMPEHRRADKNGYVRRAILIAEQVLGKPLPTGSEVHHFNEIKGDDENNNLIICENKQYHHLLHQRARALQACNHASWRKCPYCKQYDDPVNMIQPTSKNQMIHRQCRIDDQKERRKTPTSFC